MLAHPMTSLILSEMAVTQAAQISYCKRRTRRAWKWGYRLHAQIYEHRNWLA